MALPDGIWCFQIVVRRCFSLARTSANGVWTCVTHVILPFHFARQGHAARLRVERREARQALKPEEDKGERIADLFPRCQQIKHLET
jgi:hypothetical protein